MKQNLILEIDFFKKDVDLEKDSIVEIFQKFCEKSNVKEVTEHEVNFFLDAVQTFYLQYYRDFLHTSKLLDMYVEITHSNDVEIMYFVADAHLRTKDLELE